MTPLVSIVIPCRNEEASLRKCLDSVTANDYPKDRLEILVVDGMSEDGTRDILQEYAKKYPFVRVLDNEEKMQNLALNKGIQAASGEIVMRMDAHTIYDKNYIRECVRALDEYQADNVGGRWVTIPRDNTFLGWAICFATSTPFGVGNAYYRLRSLKDNAPVVREPRWGINVPYFCCRKEVFEKVGLFNEHLDYSEDIDFRARLDAAGYRTLFMPTVECSYLMRTSLKAFLRHMFHNGYWVLVPLSFAPRVSFSLRHVVPLFFLLFLFGSLVLGFFVPIFWYFLLSVFAIYGVGAFAVAALIAKRERDFRYFLIVPFLFLALHLSYGLGSLAGFLFLLNNKMAMLFKR